MSAGSIPVFVVRDYVKPFTEQVDWSAFSFTFSPDEVPHMLQTLRSVSEDELRVMQVIPVVLMICHCLGRSVLLPSVMTHESAFALLSERFGTECQTLGDQNGVGPEENGTSSTTCVLRRMS